MFRFVFETEPQQYVIELQVVIWNEYPKSPTFTSVVLVFELQFADQVEGFA